MLCNSIYGLQNCTHSNSLFWSNCLLFHAFQSPGILKISFLAVLLICSFSKIEIKLSNNFLQLSTRFRNVKNRRPQRNWHFNKCSETTVSAFLRVVWFTNLHRRLMTTNLCNDLPTSLSENLVSHVIFIWSKTQYLLQYFGSTKNKLIII